MGEENKDKDLVLYGRLFQSQKETYEDTWLENERYYRAKFDAKFLKEVKKRKRKHTFVPKIRNIVDIHTAIFYTAFFGDGNPVELKPRGESESELLTDRNKVLDWYYENLSPQLELRKAFKSALLYKMGVVATYYDKAKDKVVTIFIPITDIAFDNECMNINDVEVIAYKRTVSKVEISKRIDSKYYNQKKLKTKLFPKDDTSTARRFEEKSIFIKSVDGWKEKIFVRDILVREKKIEDIIFQYGYAYDELPAIDETERSEQILCYGADIPSRLKDLQDELNFKRNIRSDIQEKNLNPDVFVDEETSIKPSDLQYGEGKAIKLRKGKIAGLQERTTQTPVGVSEDIGITSNDMREGSSINSIHNGDTGSSDRRSAPALSIVNSNSSLRIEESTMLLNETLFVHWAKRWVKLIFKNADDETINKITGKEFPFGQKGKRDDITYDLIINFGMTVDKEKKINDLLNILQMIAQNPNINSKFVEKLLKRVLDMRIGEDTELEELFKDVSKEVNPNDPESLDPETKDLIDGKI